MSQATAPLAYEIREAQRVSGLSRSAIYRLLAEGRLRAKKHGGRTLVLASSIDEYLNSLPEATFRAPKKAA